MYNHYILIQYKINVNNYTIHTASLPYPSALYKAANCSTVFFMRSFIRPTNIDMSYWLKITRNHGYEIGMATVFNL